MTHKKRKKHKNMLFTVPAIFTAHIWPCYPSSEKFFK